MPCTVGTDSISARGSMRQRKPLRRGQDRLAAHNERRQPAKLARSCGCLPCRGKHCSLPDFAPLNRGPTLTTPHLRGASGTPPPTTQSAGLLITANVRGGLGAGRPTSHCRLTTHTKQKAGANISFAPAVLLLRSHSLITLFVIFGTVSASSWESSYLYANFVCPFKTLTNCSLDLPSGSLFAQKHLWNGVMFVIKIVLGVMGLMPRTKAS